MNRFYNGILEFRDSTNRCIFRKILISQLVHFMYHGSYDSQFSFIIEQSSYGSVDYPISSILFYHFLGSRIKLEYFVSLRYRSSVFKCKYHLFTP